MLFRTSILYLYMFLFYEIAAGGTIKNWDVDDIEENGLR